MELPADTAAGIAESANVSGLPLYVIPRDKLRWKAVASPRIRHKRQT